MRNTLYQGIVSSDWSECLSPNGPFDPLSFVYPELEAKLARIFKDYTGNLISLEDAVGRIRVLLPRPLDEAQMEAYLDARFQTYSEVPQLIQWCLDRDILFMINTTGTHGYFQCAIKKGLIPAVPVVAANPLLQFGHAQSTYLVNEIDDKPTNTEAVIKSLNVPAGKLVVMGDSGGDGPHFHWAARSSGYLIASMAKPSLVNYCEKRNVKINRFFGLRYEPGQSRNLDGEMAVSFMQLTDVIQDALDLSS